MGSWRPEIGDPTFMGWFTTGSYFFCAITAFFVAFLARKEDRRVFFLWGAIAVLMTFLGINKQLDLQSLLTEMGRQVARAQGWMDHRRIVQFWFIVIFGTSALAMFIWFAMTMRDVFRRFRLAFLGLFFLLGFIIIRAASFHHFDEVLHWNISGARMNWVLELSGIFLIVFAGLKEMILPIFKHD